MILINQYRSGFGRVTAAASCACAVHCALTPLLLASVPAIGGVLADERVEAALIVIAVMFGGLNLRTACRDRSRSRLRVALYVGGIVLIAAGHALFDQRTWLETTVAITGGFLLATAWFVGVGVRRAECCRHT